MPRLLLCIAAAALGLAPSLTLAQQGQTDMTGTGGGPDTTITAPNTTSTGTTMPPGSEEGPATPGERRALERMERDDRRIEDSICVGCGR